MKTNSAGCVIGAYPCAPSFHQGSEEEEKNFQRQLSEIPDTLRLEQPYLENFRPLGDQWLLRHTPEDWEFVVIAIMKTMCRRNENSGFSLAPSGEEQCQACVAYYRHLFNKINSPQANRVLALGLQAAPLTTNLNVMQAADAFACSLKEVASWDWPCKLVLEHCDAMTSPSPRKDFSPLRNVLGVITDYGISICISWTHSAIEGCNTTLPLTHTQMVKQAGKLSAPMFSGMMLSGTHGEWQDSHTLFVLFCAESLTATDHILELFNIVGSSTLHLVGIKLLETNATTDVHHRTKILRNDIHSLNESR